MKKLMLIILPAMLLVSCSKSDYTPVVVDESYWLKQDRALVVESSFTCDTYIVNTYLNGYVVIRNWGGMAPIPGSVIYGNYFGWGLRDFYNRSNGKVFRAEVLEYNVSYTRALQAMYYNCP
jgi:hypothetical protein